MKTLLINYEYPPLGGGAGNATRAIGERLVTLGSDVTVVTMSYRNLPREETGNGVRIIRVPSLRKSLSQSNVFEMVTYILSSVLRGPSVFSSFKPDAMLAFLGIPSGVVAGWYKTIYRIPYIVSVRGGDVPGTQPEQMATYHKLCKPLIKKVWRGAAYVVANSKGLQDLARETMPDREILMIPNGVDVSVFKPSPKKTRHDEIKLLYVGRLSYEKRLDLLIEALANLKDNSWQLTIVGEGPVRKELEKKVQTHGLQDRITFAGWIDREELPATYGKADLFVFPSNSEGMPNVVLEAMASGLPVITTKIRGCEELVKHEENGLLIEPDNQAKLETALKRVLIDEGTRIKFGQASIKRAHEFSWDEVARKYHDLLSDAAKGHTQS
jgi:glycosyltransferase involved in cell wall biosynthesis